MVLGDSRTSHEFMTRSVVIISCSFIVLIIFEGSQFLSDYDNIYAWHLDFRDLSNKDDFFIIMKELWSIYNHKQEKKRFEPLSQPWLRTNFVIIYLSGKKNFVINFGRILSVANRSVQLLQSHARYQIRSSQNRRVMINEDVQWIATLRIPKFA